MMIRILVATLAFSLQEVAMASAPICDGAGGFGQSFGASKIDGVVNVHEMNGVAFTPSKAFPPFGYFEAGMTHKSGKIWSVSAVAEFEKAEDARAFKAHVIEELSSSQTITEKRNGDFGVVELYTGSEGHSDTDGGQKVFYHTAGLKVEVGGDSSDKEVSVSCSNLKLEQQQVSETLGK